MEKLDLQEVKKHIDILNVAYHLCLEIIVRKGYEYKAICPFCGYNKKTKIPTMSLNISTNQYSCCRCGAGGFSIGLYAKVKEMSNKNAYKELLERQCRSTEREKTEISPINLLADIEYRDAVYREFLGMLKLERQHQKYLSNMGFLSTSIEENLYRSIPKNYIKRRMICNSLSKKYELGGIPGFYQEEDFKWCFNSYDGFFVPVFDNDGYIQGLSIHLNKLFNNISDLWFSSSGKINGTSAKSWIMKNNITSHTKSVILTDNLLLGNLITEVTNVSVLAFQGISNSYSILKEIEGTNINKITFMLRIPECNENIDYIINRIFRDLIPLGYELDIKYVKNYKDFFDEKSDITNISTKIA